jgi:hypothetical protein
MINSTNHPRIRTIATVVVALVLLTGLQSGIALGQCTLPNNTGTVVLPDSACPMATTVQDFKITTGLPAGTEILIAGILNNFICQQEGVPQEFCNSPGGALGGETQFFDATLEMHMEGTGALQGFSRLIHIPINAISETGPRVPGDAVQDFDNEMVQLQGGIFGDPDFDILAIRAGRNFGLPSPGHTTLTRLGPPGSDFAVDSFFDIFYEIDFQGAPGSILEGMSGTTQGIVRMGGDEDPIAIESHSWGHLKSIFR